jgi:hypothetical protein
LHEWLLMPLSRPLACLVGAAIFAMVAPLVCAAAAPEVPEHSLYDALADYNESLRDQSGAQRAEAVVDRYERIAGAIDPCGKAGAPIHDDDLFRATVLAEGYSFDPRHVRKIACLYRRLQAQGRITRWHVMSYAEALASISRFDEANRILASLHTRPVAPLPALSFAQKADSRRVIDIDSPTHAVVRSLASRERRLAVFAVVHPDCHFSVNGLAEIVANEDDRWLREVLVLLVAPGPTPPVDGILAWNRGQPTLPMHLMYRRNDWKFLKSIDTPTFYLMRGDTILDTFTGWPNPNGLARMKAALQRERHAQRSRPGAVPERHGRSYAALAGHLP